MAQITHDDLMVCEDCTMLIANGECAPEWTREGELIERSGIVSDAQVARWGELAGHLVLTCECAEGCESSFSWSQCDGCGSTLGGSRHAACVIQG